MKKKIAIAILATALSAGSAEASWFSKIFPSWGSHGKRNHHNSAPVQRDPVSVPEPATMVLLGLGLAGLAAFNRFKK